MSEQIELALAGVLGALERLTVALPVAPGDAEKLSLFRRCYHQIIDDIDKLDDATKRRLLRL